MRKWKEDLTYREWTICDDHKEYLELEMFWLEIKLMHNNTEENRNKKFEIVSSLNENERLLQKLYKNRLLGKWGKWGKWGKNGIKYNKLWK